MSGLMNKLTRGQHKQQSDNQEQSFSILPHPAKTNDPNDLRGPDGAQPVRANDPLAAHKAMPGPVMPGAQMRQDLPPAASRDEMSARAAELNN